MFMVDISKITRVLQHLLYIYMLTWGQHSAGNFCIHPLETRPTWHLPVTYPAHEFQHGANIVKC